MASAANHVFNTYELLENIMLNLSMIELYALQSLNHTFLDITLHSERIKSIMNFTQVLNATTPDDLTIKTPQFWLNDLCHGHSLAVQDLKASDVRINPVIHHLCKTLRVQAVVHIEGPIFRLSGDPHSEMELILRQRHCKLRLYANPQTSLAKTGDLRRLSDGPSGPFLVGSWMTDVPMEVECGVIGVGEMTSKPLKFEMVVGKQEATVGKVLTVLLEYLDVLRV